MKQQFHWPRFFRRTLALTTAALGLWLLLLGSGGLPRAEADSTAPTPPPKGQQAVVRLPFWQQLAVEQSAVLAANPLSALPTAPPPPTASPRPEAQPAPDRDDLDQSHTTPAPADQSGIVERTLVPTSGQGYVTGGGLYLYDRSGLGADLNAALQTPLQLGLAPTDQGPQVLILHTHSTEAYCQIPDDPYVPTDANARTLDPAHSVIRVGEEVRQVLEEMGLSVIHDQRICDHPDYNGAYGRSGAAAADWLRQYPTIRLVLDLHRDALVDEAGTIYKTVTTIDGKKTAQVMLVVGSNGLGGHPNWQANLALAARIQRSLDTLYPTLARPITLRKGTYNQELSPGALLVEVGTHGNTLEEALAGARLFARAAGSVLLGEMKG